MTKKQRLQLLKDLYRKQQTKKYIQTTREHNLDIMFETKIIPNKDTLDQLYQIFNVS